MGIGKEIPPSYKKATERELEGKPRPPISIDQYWECFHDSMRRFSLIANSLQRPFSDRAAEWLSLPDSRFRERFESDKLTQGDALYELELEGLTDTPLTDRDFAEKFYGSFECKSRPDPKHDHWTRELPLAFFVSSYEGLYKPKYDNSLIGWDNSKNEEPLMECATNYLVRNCWHNYVHVMLQGIRSTNYHNFKGRARDEADMEADTLSLALLARSYGIPVSVSGLPAGERPPDSRILQVVRRNKCNKMFGGRADHLEENPNPVDRYLRTVWNYIGGWLLAEGYAAGSLGAYLGNRLYQEPNRMMRMKTRQVVVQVNGLRIGTGIDAAPRQKDEGRRNTHFRDVAKYVTEYYLQALRLDSRLKSNIEAQTLAKFKIIGVNLK